MYGGEEKRHARLEVQKYCIPSVLPRLVKAFPGLFSICDNFLTGTAEAVPMITEGCDGARGGMGPNRWGI
jgi:hypothetical protein